MHSYTDFLVKIEIKTFQNKKTFEEETFYWLHEFF